MKPSFLIYIDVLSNGFKTKCKLFADDTSLFFVVHNVDTSVNDLNHELKKTHFNVDPSKQAQETTLSSKKTVSIHLVVYFNDTPVNPTVTCKHLRKILDSKLSY